MLAADLNEPHSGLDREHHVRIALFYNRDIYAHKALNLLTPRLSDHSLSFFYSNFVGGNIVRDVRLQNSLNLKSALMRDRAELRRARAISRTLSTGYLISTAVTLQNLLTSDLT